MFAPPFRQICGAAPDEHLAERDEQYRRIDGRRCDDIQIMNTGLA